MGSVPTVKVVNPKMSSDYTTINQSDYDPKVHRLWGEDTAPRMQLMEATTRERASDTPKIPENWRELKWPQKRSLASKLTDVPVTNSASADRAILDALRAADGADS